MPEPPCLALFCIQFRTLACAECGLHQTVFRESWEKPLKRSPSNFVVDFSSSFLLQDRVAVHSQNVVDATDTAERARALLE